MILKKLFAAVTVFIMIIGLLPDYNEKFMDSAITADAAKYNDDLGYQIVNDYVIVYNVNKNVTSIVIPSTIQGLPVKKIDSSGFANCYKLSHIELPNTLEEIGISAFYQCDSLVSIEIPRSVKRIMPSAFYDCSFLETVIFNEGLENIERLAFSYCEKLKYIDLPSTMKYIGEDAFDVCFDVESVTLKSMDCSIYNDSSTFPSATFYGYEGSTFQQYANMYGRKYEILPGGPAITTTTTTTTTTTMTTTTTTTTTPKIEPTIKGDVNCDDRISVADVVSCKCYLINGDVYSLSPIGLLNADVHNSGNGINVQDAIAIQKKILRLIDSFDGL